MKTCLVILALVGGCLDSVPQGPTVKLQYVQPGVPEAVQTAIESGAKAWESTGISVDSSLDADACALDWYDVKTFPCTITIHISFAASSTLGHDVAGLTAYRFTTLAYELSGEALINVAAHEIGHSVWNSGDHLAPGLAGIMSAFASDLTQPTDADLDYVSTHTNGWYAP